MHVIAAKAVAFKVAATESFRDRQAARSKAPRSLLSD